MTKPLPKWITYRYSKLWNKFNTREFNYEKVLKTLKEKEISLTSVILSELKKHGWLSVKLNPKDSRKRIYKLISPEEAIKQLK